MRIKGYGRANTNERFINQSKTSNCGTRDQTGYRIERAMDLWFLRFGAELAQRQS